MHQELYRIPIYLVPICCSSDAIAKARKILDLFPWRTTGGYSHCQAKIMIIKHLQPNAEMASCFSFPEYRMAFC